MTSTTLLRRGLRQRELPQAADSTVPTLDAANLASARRVASGEVDAALLLDHQRQAVMFVTRGQEAGVAVRMVPISRFTEGRSRKRLWPWVLAGITMTVSIAAILGWAVGSPSSEQDLVESLQRENAKLSAENNKCQQDAARSKAEATKARSDAARSQAEAAKAREVAAQSRADLTKAHQEIAALYQEIEKKAREARERLERQTGGGQNTTSPSP